MTPMFVRTVYFVVTTRTCVLNNIKKCHGDYFDNAVNSVLST